MHNFRETFRRNAVLWVGSALAIGVTLFADVQTLRNFDWWAIWDHGGQMVLVKLLNSGLQPNVDFGYTYGPLTVLIYQAWAAVFGNQWMSFLYMMLLFRLVSCVLLVWVAARLRLSALLQAVFVLGLFRWLPFNFGISHPGEVIALLLAISCIMSSRFDLALAACALATVFRPAAGFVVGLILVSILLWQNISQTEIAWRTRLTRLLQSFAPSAILEIVVAATYLPLHGAASYIFTMLPLAGGRAYARIGEDYLTPGWNRYFPPQQNWKGYFTNPSHLDLLVLLTVAAGLIVGVVRNFQKPTHDDQPAARWHPLLVLICVSSVVVVAMTVCYGGGNGVYYYYLPFFWLGPFVAWQIFGSYVGNPGRVVVGLVGINLAACAIFTLPGVPALFGKTRSADADKVSLADSQFVLNKDEYEDLRQIGEKGSGKTIVFPRQMGDVTLLKQFGLTVQPNEFWCLEEGLSLPIEISRAQDQVRHAEYLLLKKPRPSAIERILKVKELPTDVVYQGKYYELLHVRDLTSKTASDPK